MNNREIKIHCDLCGSMILPVTYKKYNGICARCHKTNERDTFLLQGGMPDDRYEVLVVLRLQKELFMQVFSESYRPYVSIRLVARGVNDYYAEKWAEEIVKKKILQLSGQQEISGLNLKFKSVEVDISTPLSRFCDIETNEFEFHLKAPAILPSKPSDNDLKSYEGVLVKATEETLKEFLKTHGSEVFYGLCFDCSAEYGTVQISMNTEREFEKTAANYVKDYNYSEQQIKDLKNNSGVWFFQGINHDYDFWTQCRDYEQKIEEYVFNRHIPSETSEQLVDEVLTMFTRGLLRFEQSEVFKKIKRTNDFKLIILDHEESFEDGLNRMTAVKEFMSLT